MATSIHQLRHFDRISCALVTYLSAFQLTLEQVFYNDAHPQFTESLTSQSIVGNEDPDDVQELSPRHIRQELLNQRDRVPQEVVVSIAGWTGALLKTNIHAHIRCSVMQVIYIICDSELSLVLLSETDFYTTLFKVADAVFIKGSINYSKGCHNINKTLFPK